MISFLRFLLTWHIGNILWILDNYMVWLTVKTLVSITTYPNEILSAMRVIKDRMYHYGYDNITEHVLTIQTYGGIDHKHKGLVMMTSCMVVLQPLQFFSCSLAITPQSKQGC